MKTKSNTVLNENTSFIKLIALITMVIDHVGLVLLDNNIIFRIIGRLSFPLFAYSTFIGYFKTKDLKKYLLRLLLIGIISEPIFMIVFNKNILTLNVMFALLFEVLLLYSLDKKKWLYIPFIFTFLILLNIEYSLFILLYTLMFYYLRNKKYLFITCYILLYLYLILYDFPSVVFNISFFMVFALPLMVFKTNINVKINKWFYYIFYPAHLLLLYLISLI